MASDDNGNGADVLDPTDLTHWVESARRGLRRDVADLVRRLEQGELFVPLAKQVPGAEVGTRVELDEDLTITPHMLEDDDGHLFCAMFTRPDILEPLAEQLGWLTDDGALEYCSLPAKVGLDLAHQVIDDENVVALIINAGHDTELMLHRHEVGSIASGRALPLVGYVRDIPVQDFEKTLIAEAESPPPAAFVSALESCLAELGNIERYEVLSTFNADRDLEPHMTLSLRPKSRSIDFEQVTKQLIDTLGELVPPPGYIDIVFDQTPEPPLPS
ncbi:MAG: SseB family protein [Myxococcales bacterium]|nr:SseB family protein [Myxococcales bacterium]